MSMTRIVVLATAAALALAACGNHEISFSSDVNPILQKNCAVCHAPGKPGYEKSGFSVLNYKDVMAGTRNGPVIEPGSSVGSTLVRLIRHQADPSINMPKNFSEQVVAHGAIVMPGSGARSLSKHDIDVIAKWVDQGAKNN